VLEVLPDALRALAIHPVVGDLGERGLGGVAVGRVGRGCRDDAASAASDRVDVGHVARGVVGREPTPFRE
jgi:hypothetical protein